MRQAMLFVGSYTQGLCPGNPDKQANGRGIDAVRLDLDTGQLSLVRSNPGIANPSFVALSPDGKTLYAVNELQQYQGEESGAISAFRIASDSGTLELLNSKSTHGASPCHISITGDGKTVFAANYGGGSACAFATNPDGSLAGEAEMVHHLGKGTHPTRQTAPHAHSLTVDPTQRYAIVADLGLDALMIYEIIRQPQGVSLRFDKRFDLTPGSGPRHMVFSADGQHCYLVNELNATVCVLRWDGAGGFTLMQTLSTLIIPFEGDNLTADIHLSPNGQFLYASNRGQDSIAVYRVSPDDGMITALDAFNCGGGTPRSFAISPDGCWMVVANQDSDRLCAFAIDPTSGALKRACSLEVPSPTCVRFV